MSKDKIELSFAAFRRWYKQPSGHDYLVKERWEDLCAEAEKRDKIVQWAVVIEGKIVQSFDREYYAINTAMSNPNAKVIKLVEAEKE